MSANESSPAVGCDCIRRTNEDLAAENTRLVSSRLFRIGDPSMVVAVYISTELIQKKRGAKPIRIFPTFCPFCARPYRAEDAIDGVTDEVPS